MNILLKINPQKLPFFNYQHYKIAIDDHYLAQSTQYFQIISLLISVWLNTDGLLPSQCMLLTNFAVSLSFLVSPDP